EHQNVIDIKKILVKITVRYGDERAEHRRRVGGVRQPIFVEVAAVRGGQAMQVILVLIGVIQRRLRVREAEDQRQEQRRCCGSCGKNQRRATQGGRARGGRFIRTRGVHRLSVLPSRPWEN